MSSVKIGCPTCQATIESRSTCDFLDSFQSVLWSQTMIRPFTRGVLGGATFHTIRHSMNTFIGKLKVHPVHHQNAAGHEDFATTLLYLHLDVDDQIAPLEQLSAELPISALVEGARSRAQREPRGDIFV